MRLHHRLCREISSKSIKCCPATECTTIFKPSSEHKFTPSRIISHYDYDKSVEVEQRKIINPDTTPTSIRLWLILFDIYSKHPNRLLSMTEAFGETALMSLRFMFPDEHMNRHFLTTTNLFADIKAATAKVAMKSIVTTPLPSTRFMHISLRTVRL